MNLAEIIRYEFFELGNTDIPEYCFATYALPENIVSEWQGYISELEDNGYVDDYNEADQLRVSTEFIIALEDAIGMPLEYGYWLADLEAVKQNYCRGEHGVMIDGYEIDEGVILSDLGEMDGALYAFTYCPTPVESFLS